MWIWLVTAVLHYRCGLCEFADHELIESSMEALRCIWPPARRPALLPKVDTPLANRGGGLGASVREAEWFNFAPAPTLFVGVVGGMGSRFAVNGFLHTQPTVPSDCTTFKSLRSRS